MKDAIEPSSPSTSYFDNVLFAGTKFHARHDEPGPDDLVCAACDHVLTMAEYIEGHCMACRSTLKTGREA